MQIARAARFSAILNPVRTNINGQPEPHAVDAYQKHSASNYALAAWIYQNDRDAVSMEGPRGRHYTFTKEDGASLMDIKNSDSDLKGLTARINVLKEQLAELQRQKEARSVSIVGDYLEQNRDRIEVVPYRWKVTEEPTKPPIRTFKEGLNAAKAWLNEIF